MTIDQEIQSLRDQLLAYEMADRSYHTVSERERREAIKRRLRELESVSDEILKLRAFKDKAIQIIIDADNDRHSLGSLTGGMLSQVLNERAPVTITRYGAVDAYVIPEHLIRELLEIPNKQ